MRLDSTEQRLGNLHNSMSSGGSSGKRRRRTAAAERSSSSSCERACSHHATAFHTTRLTTLWLLLSLWRSAECFGVVAPTTQTAAGLGVHAHPHASNSVPSFCYDGNQKTALLPSCRTLRLSSTCLNAVALDAAPARATRQQKSSSRRSSGTLLEPSLVLEQPQQQQQQQQHRVAAAPKLTFLDRLLHANDPNHHHNADVVDNIVVPNSASSSIAETATLHNKQQQRCTVSTPPPPVLTPAAKNAEAWARKYTTVEALRQSFGGSKNGVWGDLDAASARKLYKALLPTALLDLHDYYSHQLQLQQEQEASTLSLSATESGGSSGTDTTKTTATTTADYLAADLAPLAYQARLAAKLYARERCTLPARVAANLYDGFRQWRRYGQFNMHGMSYQQVWDKYAKLLLQQQQQDAAESSSSSPPLDESTAAAKIGLKILERACSTNPVVDQLVLKEGSADNSNKKSSSKHAASPTQKALLSAADLQKITAQLEEDVQQLLLSWRLHDDSSATAAAAASGTTPNTTTTTTANNKMVDIRTAVMTPQRYRKLRNYARMKRKLARPFVSPAATSHDDDDDKDSPAKVVTKKETTTRAAASAAAEEEGTTTTRPRRRLWNNRKRHSRKPLPQRPSRRP